MREALAEGRKARTYCKPNPPVGCVIVVNDRLVGRGHTQPPGKKHAEAAALASSDDIDFAKATVFVTLEPCSFHGRTPSCAKALAELGVANVVIALVDPDPRNSGAGIALLRQAGVEVEVGLCDQEAFRDLSPYLKEASKALPLTAQIAGALGIYSSALGRSGAT
ncbi:5-amino-6-uracil reductase protein [Salinisphaera shabanensis E1L3A]|uniref:5-amino-6-uracil reductase protein n=1 Tax=Salinisphaera shabanensis E1L3A TaxID=1033802 RepID=U2FXV2_9GAMM|nr:bifunctional diaminohydroxyphosphoribosylaminopyrimidine deaminase/5-amino-6-(5-phosphoribosylamino)uracil reductase RibD [Salinisphaera shabanensis]ERJ20654.1 5-amino-6-uracil reductase protein [Salinisphaera shabanensis E1L3A]